jgi:hypothetical protein
VRKSGGRVILNELKRGEGKNRKEGRSFQKKNGKREIMDEILEKREGKCGKKGRRLRKFEKKVEEGRILTKERSKERWLWWRRVTENRGK